MKVEIKVHREIGTAAFGIYSFRRSESGETWWLDARTGEWVGPLEVGAMWKPEQYPKPLIMLKPHELQQLVDSVGEEGFTQARASAMVGELKATKEHLADMRRLVFDEQEPRIELRGIEP